MRLSRCDVRIQLRAVGALRNVDARLGGVSSRKWREYCREREMANNGGKREGRKKPGKLGLWELAVDAGLWSSTLKIGVE